MAVHMAYQIGVLPLGRPRWALRLRLLQVSNGCFDGADHQRVIAAADRFTGHLQGICLSRDLSPYEMAARGRECPPTITAG
ncbi:hypothetical protein BCY76_013240 [Nesterenkonia sp. PF2B19]|nr:hypothetical protein BCY76_013240 [Nesterenkonia sp. PF2B19]